MSKHASLIIALFLVVSGCGSPSDSRPDQRTEQKQVVPAEEVQVGVKTRPVESELITPQIAVSSVSPASACSAENVDFAISAFDISNRPIRLLVPTKTFSKDRVTGALKLTFDDLDLLKVLNMDPVTEDAVSWMPEWMRSLDGQMVRIRGCMYPTFEADDIEHFLLTQDRYLMFGCRREPQPYHYIQVEMKSGTTTSFVPLPHELDVIGRFKIDLVSDDDRVVGLFVIEDASVIVHR